MKAGVEILHGGCPWKEQSVPSCTPGQTSVALCLPNMN